MKTARNRDRNRDRNRGRSRDARRRRGGVRIALIGVSLALVGGLTAVGVSRASGSNHAAAATTVSYDAATKVLTFSLPAFAGGTISSTQFAGKPLVVNFYASWCEVCSLEMPQFQATYLQLKDQVAFVGINPQQGGSDTDARQAEMVAQTGVTYPTARDAQNSLLAVFNTSGAHSLGLGTPLILFAIGFRCAVRGFGFLRRHTRTIQVVGGTLLTVVGALLITGLWNSSLGAIRPWLGHFTSPI